MTAGLISRICLSKGTVMKFLSKIVCPILLGLAVVSCTKQEVERHSDGIIRVRVDSEDTKSSVYTTIDLKTAPGKFIMEAYVDRDVFNDEAGQHAHTRVGNAYFGPTEKLEENVIFEGGSWNLWYWNPANADKDKCYWVSSDGNMSFWSWVKPQKGLSDIAINRNNSALYLTSPNIDEIKGVKMLFDYTLPTPTAETNPSATSFNDASNQEDLVFSYWQDALENTTPDADEPKYPEKQDVWVHFYHALSQIRFCFSNNDGSFENELQIKSIAIGDVASGGTCTFWGKIGMDEFTKYKTGSNYDNSNPERNVASVFTWSDLKTDKTYRQDYNVTVNSSATEYAGWTTGTYDTYRLFTCQNVFMMIPQALNSKACVRLTIVDSSKPVGQQEQEFISYIKPIGDKWEAGKYYTYKLNYQQGQISFSVSLFAWGNIGDPREYTID